MKSDNGTISRDDRRASTLPFPGLRMRETNAPNHSVKLVKTAHRDLSCAIVGYVCPEENTTATETDRRFRQLAMGSAAGRHFLAAFFLPSGIIRPAMRIIAVRGRLSLWAVRPFVRSFVREQYYCQARYESKKKEGEGDKYRETEKKERSAKKAEEQDLLWGSYVP